MDTIQHQRFPAPKPDAFSLGTRMLVIAVLMIAVSGWGLWQVKSDSLRQLAAAGFKVGWVLLAVRLALPDLARHKWRIVSLVSLFALGAVFPRVKYATWLAMVAVLLWPAPRSRSTR